MTLPPCFILSKRLCKIDKIVFEALMMYSPCFFSLKAIRCPISDISSLFIGDHSALLSLSCNSSCWRGKSAIQKLSKASGSTKEEAEKWLMKQPLYQIYLLAPKYIPRPNASTSLFAKPNDTHQADILYLPHDKFKKKTYKYVLSVVDVASRYKGASQLTSKNSKEAAQAFQWIYENTPLTYPKTLIIDNGKEFCGDRTKLMEKHDVMIQRGDPSQHQSQGIVERLANRLFSYQYHKELEDPSKSNREWVSRLQNMVSALNNEKTRLIEMKPIDAIKQTLVKPGFSQPVKKYEGKLLDVGTKVRYLYESGELEGYQYEAKKGKDLLTLFGQWMYIKLRIGMFKSINQRCTI